MAERDFKVGDRIRVNTHSGYKDGTITAPSPTWWVKLADGSERTFTDFELERESDTDADREQRQQIAASRLDVKLASIEIREKKPEPGAPPFGRAIEILLDGEPVKAWTKAILRLDCEDFVFLDLTTLAVSLP